MCENTFFTSNTEKYYQPNVLKKLREERVLKQHSQLLLLMHQVLIGIYYIIIIPLGSLIYRNTSYSIKKVVFYV